jgi:NAD(P)H-hydrate repair Nnr-like enzyme with NAD(P)H-hydrate dehydratase domain
VVRLALIGLLGAPVMAVTMAMVSGVGVVRLARDKVMPFTRL